MTATLSLEIPRDVLESARMNMSEAKLELAIALFAAGRLSMGQTAELAALPLGEFQLHPGTRHLGPHYDSPMRGKIWKCSRPCMAHDRRRRRDR